MNRPFPQRIVYLSLFLSLFIMAACGSTLPEDGKKMLEAALKKDDNLSFQIYQGIVMSPGYPVLHKFLISNGYIEENIKEDVAGTIKVTTKSYCATVKLIPLVTDKWREKIKACPDVNGNGSFSIGTFNLASIDKVEANKSKDYKHYKVAFTYYIDPKLQELQRLGPYKGFANLTLDTFKEKWSVSSLDIKHRSEILSALHLSGQ